MVNEVKKSTVLNVHRLVQQVTRIVLKKQELKVLNKALKLFTDNIIQSNLSNVNHALSVWKYASQYDELVQEFSNLPCEIINKLNHDWRYQEAYSFGKQAFKLLSNKLGSGHQSTLTTLSEIADVLSNQGKHGEAFRAHKEVYDKRKDILDPNHPHITNTCIRMGMTLSRQDKYDEALQAYKEVLGPHDQNTLTALSHIADVLSNAR